MDTKKLILDICTNEYPHELDYVQTHLDRYSITIDYIRPYIIEGTYLNLGGYGTFITALERTFNITVLNYADDLRLAFNLTSNKFDGVFCFEVIEHIKDCNSDNINELEVFNWSGINNVLSECKRVKKDSGILYLSTPNLSSYECVGKILKGDNPYHYYPHPREFTYTEMLDILTSRGYTIVDSTTIDTWNSAHFYNYKTHIMQLLHNIGQKDINQNSFIISR